MVKAMPTTTPDDNWATHPSPRRPAADAHGQAALLLSESILHALVEANTFTIDQAISVVRTASDVTAEDVDERGEISDRSQQSSTLLSAIQRSLAIDATDGDGMPHVYPLKL